jgi:ubiquitin-like modifier-activating enzyme ATG7
VRQSLFEFADCLNGGKYKSEAAAAALHRIYPTASYASYILSIPMPGHPLTSTKEIHTAKQVRTLLYMIYMLYYVVSSLR